MSCPYCGKEPSPIPKVAPFCSVLHKTSYTSATAERKEKDRLKWCAKVGDGVALEGLTHKVIQVRLNRGTYKHFWTEWTTACNKRVGNSQKPQYPGAASGAVTCFECINYKPPPELPWTSRTRYLR